MSVDDLEDDEAPGRGLLEYLEIPFRYPWHFWIPYLLIFLAACGTTMILPKKFRSATLILVEPHKVPDYFVTPMTTDGITTRLNTIRQVILSRTRLEKVLKTLDPYPEWHRVSPEVQVEWMRAAIQIRVQGSDSFTIEYVNRDPQKAMLVTNMLAEQFIDDTKYMREDMTEKAFEFVRSNLEEARRALEERENALREHKKKYWGALPEQLQSNLSVLTQLQIEQQTLADNMRTLQERRGLIERNLVEGRRTADDPAGSAGYAELAKLKAALATLRSRYTDEHPDVETARLRVEKLEKRLADDSRDPAETNPETRQLSQSLQLAEAEIESLNAKRAKLDQKIADFQARVEETPKAEQDLMSLARDYQQLKENYSVMLKKEMDAEMARKLEVYWKGGYFRVLDPARIPQQPVRPYAFIVLLGGYFLAVFAGLATAFGADLLDRSVKSQRELEAILPFPVLLTIGYVRPAKRGKAA